MDNDLSAYKALFVKTAGENANGILDSLLVLEKNGGDENAITTIFIKSHSLKGQSMTMGYTGIAKAALAIERYTRQVREQKEIVPLQIINAMRYGIEKIQASLRTVEEHNSELPMSEVITMLEQKLGVKV